MHPLVKIAGELNAELARGTSMEVGSTVMHPDGYMVKIESGRFLDEKYGRVTNWWTWRRVNEDGTLGDPESGYGW